MTAHTVLATASKSTGAAIVEYTKKTAVVNSYLLGTANMFELNTGKKYDPLDPVMAVQLKLNSDHVGFSPEVIAKFR